MERGMNKLAEKMAALRETSAICAVNAFINSKYMIALLAVSTIFAHVFKLEIFLYGLMAITFVYSCLFGRDLLFLAPTVVFAYIAPAVCNNIEIYPEKSLFYTPLFLRCMVAFLIPAVVCFVFRVCTDFDFVKFFTEKRKLTLGFLIMGVAFFLGGTGYNEYTPKNLSYALTIFAAWFFLYFILTETVKWKDVPKDYFAWTAFFVAFTVMAELINVYVVNNVIQQDGSIWRNQIYTGWGIYNNMGAMLLSCMPGAFYLATVKKHGVIFNFLGNLVFLAIILTNSRSAILMGTLVYICCAVVTLFCGKTNRKSNAVFFIIIVVSVLAFAIVFREKIGRLFSMILDFKRGDGDRLEIYRQGLKQFSESPIFGQGFFACHAYKWFKEGNLLYWHNTFIQMLASYGLVGLAAYLFHRYQTVKLFLLNRNVAKTFIGLCISGILLTSLLDCHLFIPGPACFYSILLSFAEKSGETESESDNFFANYILRKQKRNEC